MDLVASLLGEGASPFLTIGAAGVTGGIASEIAGGSFADGFRNGVIAAGLNHVAHRFTGPPDKARQAARRQKRLQKQAVKTAKTVREFIETNGGSYKSISMSGVLGGGLGFELGFVTDGTGSSSLFFTISGHAGFGAGFGFNSGIITPTQNQQFLIDDFRGAGAGWEASVTIFGASQSGNFDQNGSQAYRGYGSGERGYLTGSGSIAPQVPTKLQLGGSIFRSKTWTFFNF
ncbi:hypothetical protein [Aquimarina agarilytica]|uniref:hypothetical protein n=1 Tax=Aquimarina agarilytica TaxID=1087449 RepID=UPI00028A38AB|nr:hypothetical protein [Aquimarina agarilytica]